MNVSPPLNKYLGFWCLNFGGWIRFSIPLLIWFMHLFLKETTPTMNDLNPLKKVFASKRQKLCLEPWNPLKHLWAGCRKHQTFSEKVWDWENAKLLKWPVSLLKPVNNMNVSPPLNKVSGFLVLKLWLNSFLNSLSYLIYASIAERDYP